MPINRDYVDPAELTTQVRTALADLEVNSPTSLAQYLPSEFINDIEYETDSGQGGLIEAAMYRAFDAGLQIGVDEALGGKRGRIPSLGQKYPITEEARLRLRVDQNQSLTSNIERKGKRIAAAIANQVNLKRGELLANARLDFVGNGQDFSVDFGRKPEFGYTAAGLFTDPTSDPIAELLLAQELWSDENDENPSTMLTSQAVKNAFYSHPKITQMAIGYAGNPSRIAAPQEVDALLSRYELPSFTIRPGKVKVRENDGTSTVKYLLPQDSIIMLGEGGDASEAESTSLGATFWGVTIEATKSDWGIEESEWPGIVTAVFDNDGVPAFMSVEGVAIAMPVLHNPNGVLRVKVI